MNLCWLLVPVMLTWLVQTAGALEATVKNEISTDAEGKIINERKLWLDNLRINYRAVLTGEKTISPGDFLFGCEFGRRGNGGWNIWHFLSVKTKKDGRLVSLETASPLKNIYLAEKTPERGMAELYWEGEPTLSVRVLKLAAWPQWFFLKIEAGTAIAQVQVSAYPGETTGPPERERWCGLDSGFYNLHQGKATVRKGDSSVALFNRYGGYQDKYGNFLVLLPEEIADGQVKGTYGVMVELTPEKDRKELTLALGYFYDEDREQALGFFFRQTAREIQKILTTLSWKFTADGSLFRSLVAEIDSLSSRQEAKELIAEAGYATLRREGQRYLQENNYRQLVELVEKLQELKEKIYQKLLAVYTGK